MKQITLIVFLFLSLKGNSQVGIGTTTPNGALDVNSTINGFVPPRVSLSATNLANPIINPNGGGNPIAGTIVWNTATTGTIPNNVTPGLYYWDGTRWISFAGSTGGIDWSINGNSGIDGGNSTSGGTNFLGTLENSNIDIRTNGIHRTRISNQGQFVHGAYNSSFPEDFMISVGNSSFPFAINGYSDFDGAGVYGLISSSNTIFGAVQGEYDGTDIGPGVRGINLAGRDGINFTFDVSSGVHGQLYNSTTRSFGVLGDVGLNTNGRTGGVLGTDLLASGALGYYANNGNSYSAYGFGSNWDNGGATGKSNSTLNTHIGLGIYGGVIGGWIRGNEYGVVNSGKHFANYSLGKNITNDSFVVLNKKSDGSKVATFSSTSMNISIQDNGIGKLSNGTSYIIFNKDYAEIIDESKPIIITVTPIGESNGVHIVSVDKNGFRIKENKNGISNISFNWIAIAENKSSSENISEEILTADFDNDLDAVMHDENIDGGKAIWSLNGEVIFGKKAPENSIKIKNTKSQVKTIKPKKKKI